MINREIQYERNLTGSFMKIPASLSGEFDEKVMLKRKLPGLLPVEKCYVDGSGQYWYNITGKQSLDTYCRMKEIGIDFIEKAIISICSQVEILEWNLIDTNCLKLDPELVYITNQNQEIIFTLYPDEKGDLAQELQRLMEYMLTKVDHKDMEAVHAAYGIYEKTLDPAYSVLDIRKGIVEAKQVSAKEKLQESVPLSLSVKEELYLDSTESGRRNREEAGIGMGKALEDWKENLKNKYLSKRITSGKKDKVHRKKEGGVNYLNTSRKSPLSKVAEATSYEVSMYEEIPQEIPESHPTVCLCDYKSEPQGMLLYEGGEQLDNIQVGQDSISIGQGNGVDAQIQRDTISHVHAKIECDNSNFYVEDLNSTNGTFINGETLSYKERRKLEKNDIVQFADIRYRFV